MELDDCAFPLLAGVDIYDDPQAGVRRRQHRAAGRRAPAHEGHGARRPARGQRRHLQAAGRGDRGRRGRRHQGARGRQPGQHERADRACATPTACRAERFTAMTRLDHNRAVAQLAAQGRRAGVRHHATWRSGATTRRPCTPTCSTRRCGGERAWDAVGDEALGGRRVHPARRQARRRDHRGARRVLGGVGGQRGDRPRARLGARHADGDWVSMAVPSDGSYGVEEGIISSFPCRTPDGEWEIVRASTCPTSPRADRRDGRRARRGARRRAGARPGVSVELSSPRGASRGPTWSPDPVSARSGITRYR